MKSKLKYIVIIFVAIMLFPVLRYFISKSGTGKEIRDERIPVRVQQVQLKDIQKALEYVGNVKAQSEVIVYSKVSGKIIEKAREEGAEVKKGDTIAYIDRDEVGLKFEKAPVESPIDGVVGRVFVDIGVQVTAAQSAVAMLVSMDTMRIDLDIPEIYLPKIALGQEAQVTFDAYPGEIFTGTVTKVSPVLNLINRAAPVEIQIENKDHRIKSGMFARVVLVLEKHAQVPVVIREAVSGKGEDAYVYIIKNDQASLSKVNTGIICAENVEVVSGVREGDLVVVMGQQRLYENAPVRAEIDELREVNQ